MLFRLDLSYPQIEINVNSASLQAGPGIPLPYVSLSNKVWWDFIIKP
jgi:hypothetical protein